MPEEIDMQKLSKSERKRLKKLRKKMRMEEEKARVSGAKRRKFMIPVVLIVAIIAAASYLFTVMNSGPGVYDDFASCLKAKGVVIYGNDYCSYTQEQLAAFGRSAAYLNYVKCIENEALCNEKGVSITPTWEIGGVTYSGAQSFKKLSELSGCEI